MATMQTLTKNVDGRTLNQLLAEGLMSELNYMTAEEAERAASLEADLIAAARAEVE